MSPHLNWRSSEEFAATVNLLLIVFLILRNPERGENDLHTIVKMKINLEKGKLGQMSAKSERVLIIKRKTKQEFKLPADIIVEAI